MKLVFIRHGQSVCNKLRENQKMMRYDDAAPLNEEGIAQVEKLAVFTKKIFPSYIMYTSPLARAAQSSEILHKNHPAKGLMFADDIREMRTKEQFDREITVKEWDIYLEQRYANPQDIIFGIESLQSQYNRVSAFCSDIIKKNPDGNVIIMTHAFCIEIAIIYYMGLDLKSLKSLRIHVSNTGVFVIDIIKDKSEIICMNSLAHLSRY